MATPAPIKLKCRLGLPPQAAWYLWTDPERLQAWLCAGANVEPKVGGAYELFWDPEDPAHNSTQGCTLIRWEPISRLSFTWRGPEPHLEPLMPAGSTTVDVRFVADGLGTVVYIEHAGWGEGEAWADAHDWQREAWNEALGGLRALVEMTLATLKKV